MPSGRNHRAAGGIAAVASAPAITRAAVILAGSRDFVLISHVVRKQLAGSVFINVAFVI